MVDVGAEGSVEAVAAARPDWSEPGCTPMSANRLTVACCMLASGVEAESLWLPSRPHDHCTVPAPKTSAPLAARYSVILWVELPWPTSVPQGTVTWLGVLNVVVDMSI